MRAFLGLAAALLIAPASHAQSSSEIVVGHVRVQALSPTLVRIEPQGPRGYYGDEPG